MKKKKTQRKNSKISKNTKSAKRSKNPLHIMLGEQESVRSKKDMLSSEMRLLKISQSISNYKKHRLVELTKKQLALKKLRDIKRNLTRLEKILPQPKIPGILKKEDENPKENLTQKKESPLKDSSGSIESQLREIQEKLNRLQA